KIDDEKADQYKLRGLDVEKFATNNEFIETENQRFKDIVLELSGAEPRNIVWAAYKGKTPKKVEGRMASPIQEGEWEIQYPVPAGSHRHRKLLMIGEMGMVKSQSQAKTGEIHGGIGYGIPSLQGKPSFEEGQLLREAEELCDLSSAWLISLKGMRGVDPLPAILSMLATDVETGRLIYLPGGLGQQFRNDNELYSSTDINEAEGLVLSRIDLAQSHKHFYVITGNFRNELMRYVIGSIRDGAIISGGEGLFVESLDNDSMGTSAILAARYDYQLYEIAKSIIDNQHFTEKRYIEVVNDDATFYNNDLFFDYGIVEWEDNIYTYNHSEKILQNLLDGKKKLTLVDKPENDFRFFNTKPMRFSKALTAMYLPLSLNTNKFTHKPTEYDFGEALQTFQEEKRRIALHHNWFRIINDVALDGSIQPQDETQKQVRRGGISGFFRSMFIKKV
ncbi:MAG: hypothetical protein WBA74_23255, partial [Cyclobacteriaceae bacterium]